ncbi:hypothetical protein SAMN05216339_101443 [Nitrosomonas eutropha]|uniref:DUF3147 family protein n=1 Tax=Nitrosomonas eutropha TaxID=916 RepID=A0A1I7FEH6_9PROT|nr:DUF3147 family protein [Nitrosomonas eutropha]SFU34506.1 hypothetical protein SAMN05216339_101443 [Nitrosomonas eutropha]
MIYIFIKVVITSLLIVSIAELSKRSSLIGALLASLPLTSVLAMFWLYIDTQDVGKVADLATGIFWMVIPSLVFFVSLPLLLKAGINFYLSMGFSLSATAGCYFIMIFILKYFDIKL